MNRACCASVKTAFKKVSHVIFDLDGLLLDTEKVYKQVISDIAKCYGKVFTEAVHVKLLGTVETDASRIAVKEMQLPISSERFLDIFKSESEKLLGNCAFMPGAERLVRHLHQNNVSIAVATSSTQKSVALKTSQLTEVFSLFHHIVCGGSDPEVKHGKPSPDIFMICASRFPSKPIYADCLVLEDAPNGVTAAIAAGMQCIMVPDPNIDVELTKKATLVLQSLEEVKPELFGLPSFS